MCNRSTEKQQGHWALRETTQMFANLSVVAPVQSHSVLPEVLEEGWQDFCFNVIGFHSISATTLLHHL